MPGRGVSNGRRRPPGRREGPPRRGMGRGREPPRPPNETATWMVLYELIQNVPAFTSRATWWARDTSEVQTAPARPKLVLLARAMASASVSKASAPTTGPKTSVVSRRLYRGEPGAWAGLALYPPAAEGPAGDA